MAPAPVSPSGAAAEKADVPEKNSKNLAQQCWRDGFIANNNLCHFLIKLPTKIDK